MLQIQLCTLLVLALSQSIQADYEPNWDSLDTRPIPLWYDKAKIGIFLHWGVYCVPSFGDEWFWFHWQNDKDPSCVEFIEKNYPPNWTYQDFAREFTAEFFDPNQWADLFVASGAKYVVLTSKHHEGYTLWPSKYSYSWNAMDVGPKRDLLGDLATAIRSKDLHFGLYHSLLEWFNPYYETDKANEWNTTLLPDMKVLPEMKELVETYKPEVIWSDGDWEAPDTYWKSLEFLTWLYNESPVKDTIVVNDRWGSAIMCNHGDFITCSDRYNPGHLLTKKWENAMTLDKVSWGYRRQVKIDEIFTINELLSILVETVAFGGNLLLNIGPTKEGTIIPIFQERLLQLGTWLGVNGDAIYESSPWEKAQNDSLTSGVWYTSKNATVFATVLNWPQNGLVLESVSELFAADNIEVELLGNENKLSYQVDSNQVKIEFPDLADVVSNWAWVLKFNKKSK